MGANRRISTGGRVTGSSSRNGSYTVKHSRPFRGTNPSSALEFSHYSAPSVGICTSPRSQRCHQAARGPCFNERIWAEHLKQNKNLSWEFWMRKGGLDKDRERDKEQDRERGLPWAMLPSWVCLAPVWAQLPVGTNHGGLASLHGSWQVAHINTAPHSQTRTHILLMHAHVCMLNYIGDSWRC